MKCLDRNKRLFWYSLYKGKEAIKDEYGNLTGETNVLYEEPVCMRANISPANGNAQVEQFGISEQVDKVIVTDDMCCPIDENTVLHIDTCPLCQGEAVPYDYIVKKVARSLNSISYAVSKVKVS
ncbi:MAG: hypothetical protein NC122_05060 [Faecalibacterium sp.]|nr:hypothetical protein [Ruminococcus sp.]MCM1391869.1 hypothetical protein [Ruminococcus sp.]MCM1485555.1 hypothetical protein [Faecalibacterium sp.]